MLLLCVLFYRNFKNIRSRLWGLRLSLTAFVKQKKTNVAVSIQKACHVDVTLFATERKHDLDNAKCLAAAEYILLSLNGNKMRRSLRANKHKAAVIMSIYDSFNDGLRSAPHTSC